MISAITDLFDGFMAAWPHIFYTINAFSWITANILVAYVMSALVVFVIVYYLIWDPKATTGGQLIFRFMVSLVGVVGLVYISLFLDPINGRNWNQYPGDVLWWRPIVRMVAYGYVAYSTTKLISYLIKRKWFPHKLKKIAPEELIKTRKETK